MIETFRKNRLALVGLAIVISVTLVAIFAPWISPHDPIKIDSVNMSELSELPPSLEHPMGTDVLGRDMLSRIIHGSRVSLQIGVIAVSIMLAVGIVLGVLAGYYGGFADTVVMRTADVFFAFPYILGAITLIAVLGPGMVNVFIAIGILGWPAVARIFRSSVLTTRETGYVKAAKAMGAGDLHIIVRHILPNSLGPIIVFGTLSIAAAILAEAALSFLGIGVQPPTPAWGHMLAEGRPEIFSNPYLTIFPGVAILVTVIGFILLGDGLRDALDPRARKR